MKNPQYNKDIRISDVTIDDVVMTVVKSSYPNDYVLSASHGTQVKLTDLGNTKIDSVTLFMNWTSGNIIVNPFCNDYESMEQLSVHKNMGLMPGASIVLDLGKVQKTNYSRISSTTFPTAVVYDHCMQVSIAPDNQIDADHNDNKACATQTVVVTAYQDTELEGSVVIYLNPCTDHIRVQGKEGCVDQDRTFKSWHLYT